MAGARAALLFSLGVLSLAVLLLSVACGGRQRETVGGGRPNIVLVMVDDLDLRTMESLPRLRRLLAVRGTTFENAFVTDALCCPSRATVLRGQYAHNHLIRGNEPPRGGFEKFRRLGLEDSTVATWLKAAGYRTAYFGKYMNGYGRGETHVPPGWDEWHAVAGNYLSSWYNDNGHVRYYDPAFYNDTDLVADEALSYLRRTAGRGAPFFVMLAPRAPHQPAVPPRRYADAFPEADLSRPPSFDERDVSDKPRWVRERPRLGKRKLSFMASLHRRRLRSMLAVEDMVGRLVGTLRESGELENTYIFFTSDNGFHMGEHRLPEGKWTAYEEDIRVPLVVRGPGVPEGRELTHLVLNNDLAPTFGQLGGARVPQWVDGRSLVPLLRRGSPPAPGDWRSAFLVEAASHRDSGRPGLVAVRTRRHLYVEYESGERELYDLRRDPYQLRNLYRRASGELVRDLRERLKALEGCRAEGCRVAEGPGRVGGR
ncbi:sulfatase family protein [Rubrobacter xylanophilus]|uniref:sulfatase family protein n=1 Tax=Rubrobacter xylanophilus TaxID=49319 RepID=UPI001C63CC64|nr:sulfatase [Rubrobacter xylanophilus]